MHIFYIDESGTGLGDERTHFFVLATFAIDTRYWVQLDREVSALKRRLISWAKPEDWEIKGRDIRRGEKLFQNQKWDKRENAFLQIATVLEKLPCQFIVVQVDKRLLPSYVETDSDLYRVAFWRLLDELDQFLSEKSDHGMLLLDMRSDMHSSVQDRRVLDAYREWVGSRSGETSFVELPWFGFSAFYAGLQMADYIAYLFDFVSNEVVRPKRQTALNQAFNQIHNKIKVLKIP
jgi:hypothetical protein